MACNNCDEKKDQSHVVELAERFARKTGEPQQVFVETTWKGDIFDFEPLGIRRENIIKIIRGDDNTWTALSKPETI